MKILGVGTDLVAKSRIRSVWDRFQDRFVTRILSAEEQVLFARHPTVDFLAKRFAGKEATAKALGAGIGAKLAFHEISITNLPSGKPEVSLLGHSKKWMQEWGVDTIQISLADEKDYAIAFVIVSMVE